MQYLWIVATALLTALLGLYTVPRLICPWLEKRGWGKLAARTGLNYVPSTGWGVPKRGRVVGTYRGRDLTLNTFKQWGAELYMRIVLSVNSRLGNSMLLVRTPAAAREASMATAEEQHPFLVRESQPSDLVDRVLEPEDLCQRFEQVLDGIRPDYCRVELSGHLLKFELKPRQAALRGVERDAERLHALLDVLCDVADRVEQVTA